MLFSEQNNPIRKYTLLYNLIVPKNNLLRKIKDLIDFSFIYDDLLNKYCLTNGRAAESPIIPISVLNYTLGAFVM